MLRFRKYISGSEPEFEQLYNEIKIYNSSLIENYKPKLAGGSGLIQLKDFQKQFIDFTGRAVVEGSKSYQFKNPNDLDIKLELESFLGKYLDGDILYVPAGHNLNVRKRKPVGEDGQEGVGQGSGTYGGFYFYLRIDGNKFPVLIIIQESGGSAKSDATETTDRQEISKLLVLAAYHAGNVKKIEDITFSNIKSSIGKVWLGESKILESRAEEVIGWLNSEGAKEWKADTWKAVKLMDGEWAQPAKYIKDDKSLKINVWARALWKQKEELKGQRFDVDKWNPADIWFYYNDALAEKPETLEALNAYLVDCTLSAKNGTPKGILGISLKQGSSSVSYYNLDPSAKSIEIVSGESDMPYGIMARFGTLFSQNVYTDYKLSTGGTTNKIWSICYRIFSGEATDLVRGSASNSSQPKALHGKVNINNMNLLNTRLFDGSNLDLTKRINLVRGSGTLEWDGSEWTFTKVGKYRFRAAKKYWNTVKRGITMGIIYPRTKKDRGVDISTIGDSSKLPDDVNLLRQYNVLENEEKFLEALNNFVKTSTATKSKDHGGEWVRGKLETILSARFQCLAVGSLFVLLARMYGKEKLALFAAGMLAVAKSSGTFSSAHAKVE